MTLRLSTAIVAGAKICPLQTRRKYFEMNAVRDAMMSDVLGKAYLGGQDDNAEAESKRLTFVLQNSSPQAAAHRVTKRLLNQWPFLGQRAHEHSKLMAALRKLDVDTSQDYKFTLMGFLSRVYDNDELDLDVLTKTLHDSGY